MDSKEYTKITQTLVDVAMGRLPADMVIRTDSGGLWRSVKYPNTDSVIKDQRIAKCGEVHLTPIGKETQVIDANGRYISPGLLDGHMHIDSGMITITEFVRAIIPHGTTGIFVDPHEIANVFGLKGVELMVNEAANQPIHVWVQMPSCVPSAPGLETPWCQHRCR